MKGRSLVFMLILAAVLLCGAVSASAAVRTVLVEGFTNWSCGPCAAWNPQELSICNAFTRDTVVTTKVHVNWPGPNDGFYLWNVSEATSRWGYYSVNWVPWVMINGSIDMRNVSATTLRNSVRNTRALAAPCTIEMSASVSGATSVHVTGTITATDSAVNGANDKLFLVLITDGVHYSSPPGSNGETFFPDVFRDMWPNTSGQAISIPLNGTYDIDATLNKDASWAPDSLSVIAFVQNYATKWVHQAAWTEVMNLWQIDASTTDPRQQITDVTGGEVAYTVHATNRGRNDDVYTVTLGGQLPAGWTRTVSANGIPSDPTEIEVPLTSGQATDISIRVNPNGHGGSLEMPVNIQSQNDNATHATKNFRLMAGLDILMVDDDGGSNPGPGDFENFYLNAWEGTGQNRVFGWWDLRVDPLDENWLPQIPMVLWMTGSSPLNNTLSAAEQSTLEMYVNGGGKLFLTGQGIAFDLRTSSFLSDVLHCQHIIPFPSGHNMTGVAGSLGEGLNLVISGGDGAGNQTRQNKIRPVDQYATRLFGWDGVNADTCAALQIETSTYRAVFLAFGLEAVNSAAARADLMGRVTNWLLGPEAADPRQEVTPSEFALGQNYPNPFNPETVIPFSLPIRANVSLRVFDILGREVAVLASGLQEPGAHAVTWNAAAAASGLYFYRLEATSGDQEFHATRKLMLLK